MPRIKRSATKTECAVSYSRDSEFMLRDLAKNAIDGPPKSSNGRGSSFPLGPTLSSDGVNFSVFAKHSTAAQLLLFDTVDDPEPSRVIDFDPSENRTYHYWHVSVSGVTAGQIYGYRMSGPFDPASGLRFDPQKPLL